MRIFSNVYKDTNKLHPKSEHAGLPVIKGEKYAFNLWFREAPRDKLLSEYCDGLNLSELDSWINFTYEYNDQYQLISVDGNTVGEFTDIAIINLTMEYIYDLDSNLTNVDNMIEYTWYSDYQGGYVTTTNLNTISCEYNNAMFSSTHRSLSKAIEAIKLTNVNRNNLLD